MTLEDILEKELIELKLRRCDSSSLFEMVMINELIKVNTKDK